MAEADAKKAINEICPWSGKPVHPDALIEHNGHTVSFCSREHCDHFKEALDHFSEAAVKKTRTRLKAGIGPAVVIRRSLS